MPGDTSIASASRRCPSIVHTGRSPACVISTRHFLPAISICKFTMLHSRDVVTAVARDSLVPAGFLFSTAIQQRRVFRMRSRHPYATRAIEMRRLLQRARPGRLVRHLRESSEPVRRSENRPASACKSRLSENRHWPECGEKARRWSLSRSRNIPAEPAPFAPAILRDCCPTQSAYPTSGHSRLVLSSRRISLHPTESQDRSELCNPRFSQATGRNYCPDLLHRCGTRWHGRAIRFFPGERVKDRQPRCASATSPDLATSPSPSRDAPLAAACSSPGNKTFAAGPPGIPPCRHSYNSRRAPASPPPRPWLFAIPAS